MHSLGEQSKDGIITVRGSCHKLWKVASVVRAHRGFYVHGCFWLSCGASTCSWLLRTAPGCPWLHLAVSSCVWVRPAVPGCFCQDLACPGCSRLLLAASECGLLSHPETVASSRAGTPKATSCNPNSCHPSYIRVSRNQSTPFLQHTPR